jgi:hypothetical protein
MHNQSLNPVSIQNLRSGWTFLGQCAEKTENRRQRRFSVFRGFAFNRQWLQPPRPSVVRAGRNVNCSAPGRLQRFVRPGAGERVPSRDGWRSIPKHEQILLPIAAMSIPFQPRSEKGRGFRGVDRAEPDGTIKIDQMRVRNAEARALPEHLGNGQEELFPDALALDGRVNLHASQHGRALFRRESNDADELAVSLGEEHRIPRLDPATILPLGVERSRAGQVFGHCTADLQRHSRYRFRMGPAPEAQAREAGSRASWQ